MLARRSATEVAVHDEDRGAQISGGLLKACDGSCGAVIFEQMPLETFEGHRAQKARRHDAIGVEVVAAQWQRTAGDQK